MTDMVKTESAAYYLGIDIGGTKCAVSLGKYENGIMTVAAKEKTETKGKPQEVLEKLYSSMLQILDENRLEFCDIKATGISCGGPLDPKNGIIMSPPNLPGWDNVEAVKFFERKTGILTVLENDANACAVAEWKLGAGRGFDNIIFLTFGTGLGAGLILDGKLYSGSNGNAGEAGHIRLSEYGPAGYGKCGSFEGFCSGKGIAQLGKTLAVEAIQSGVCPAYCSDMSLLEEISAKSIADAAENGDETALEVYRMSGRMLGRGLSVLVDILNPQRIIIGSIFARSRNLLFDECDAVMKRECLAPSYGICKVVPAQLGENIGDYAALSLALSLEA